MPAPTDAMAAVRIALVTHHLFSPKQGAGTFVRIGDLEERAMGKAYRDLMKQGTKPAPADEGEEEGLLKELQPVPV